MARGYKAKLAQLEYEEKSGKLVDKATVYSTLFSFGQEIRDKVLAIPDRVVDGMLAASSRSEAFNLLYSELVSTLTVLSEGQQKDFAPKR